MHSARVAQALHGAILQARNDIGQNQAVTMSQGMFAALRAMQVTQSVEDKLYAQGFDAEQVRTAIGWADEALQRDPARYPMFRTDEENFLAATGFALTQMNAQRSPAQARAANPGRPLARIGGARYTPSTPATSAGDGPTVAREAIDAVERAMKIKIRPETLALGQARRSA